MNPDRATSAHRHDREHRDLPHLSMTARMARHVWCRPHRTTAASDLLVRLDRAFSCRSGTVFGASDPPSRCLQVTAAPSPSGTYNTQAAALRGIESIRENAGTASQND
jgi:hypothetical protein